eukprot:CAMPEP_0202891946 /NCGR_PEP_ID=MMETSP1392-20130828/1846_1 /ASSEMBLY_ACC=CAM_ASM_000868 /TAXON_ID=225041 /ORGANISM="Chlamydomonas chlamydogama, Strain SAG 11-48b" /LENGTH=239 /DNA_ID=CAMNT_0049575815 /DNA_START=943 /DNA_END=1661 /DNA_ORIENTATION=-
MSYADNLHFLSASTRPPSTASFLSVPEEDASCSPSELVAGEASPPRLLKPLELSACCFMNSFLRARILASGSSSVGPALGAGSSITTGTTDTPPVPQVEVVGLCRLERLVHVRPAACQDDGAHLAPKADEGQHAAAAHVDLQPAQLLLPVCDLDTLFLLLEVAVQEEAQAHQGGGVDAKVADGLLQVRRIRTTLYCPDEPERDDVEAQGSTNGQTTQEDDTGEAEGRPSLSAQVDLGLA